MKFTSKIKKISAAALMGAVLIASASTLSVHAQTIDEVSTSKPGYGITTTNDGSGVNVRNAPNLTTSNIIVSIPNNSPVMIVGQSGNFYMVQYDKDGHYGYIYKPYLDFKPQNYYWAVKTASDPLNMRESASDTATIIAKIPHDGAFAFYKIYLGPWCHGVYGNVVGYTSKDYTSLERY